MLKTHLNKATLAAIGTIACVMGLTRGVSAAEYEKSPTKYWTNGVVPYVYADDFIELNKVPVEAAMTVWESVANITFVVRTNETDYVKIRNAGPGAGSSSPFIGKNGGEQPLNIRDEINTWTVTAYTYGLAHEWGHVLGWHHTHQRPDRNNFVTLYNSRIDDCKLGNFTIENTAIGFPRNQMDYDSVMSYGECIFSNCGMQFDPDCDCGEEGCQRWTAIDCSMTTCCSEDTDNCRTIEIVNPADRAMWQSALGQRNHLSDIDAMNMSFLYPQPNWRFVEKDSAVANETGTFLEPHKTLEDSEAAAPQNAVIWMLPGSYSTSEGVHNTNAIIRAPLGGVVLK